MVLKLPTSICALVFWLDHEESFVIRSLASSIEQVRAWDRVGWARKSRNVIWAMRG
jgi:hypothetical protein